MPVPLIFGPHFWDREHEDWGKNNLGEARSSSVSYVYIFPHTNHTTRAPSILRTTRFRAQLSST